MCAAARLCRGIGAEGGAIGASCGTERRRLRGRTGDRGGRRCAEIDAGSGGKSVGCRRRTWHVRIGHASAPAAPAIRNRAAEPGPASPGAPRRGLVASCRRPPRVVGAGDGGLAVAAGAAGCRGGRRCSRGAPVTAAAGPERERRPQLVFAHASRRGGALRDQSFGQFLPLDDGCRAGWRRRHAGEVRIRRRLGRRHVSAECR